MPHDSPIAIDDDDLLLRRLAIDHVTGDRVNSLAYSKKAPYEISVNLSRLSSQELTLADRPNFGLGIISARDVRELGLAVRYDPEPNNVAHCLITGEYSRAIAKELAKRTRIARHPKKEPVQS